MNVYKRALLTLAGVAMLLAQVWPAAPVASHHGPVIHVDGTTTSLDEPDAAPGDGVCSSAPSAKCTLRAAVEEGQAINRAVVVPDGHFRLTRGQLAVRQNLTLTGNGSGKTRLDGNGQGRVFDVAGGGFPGGGFLYLGGVTVQGGTGGQSIVVPGHCHGGAIHNHGTMILVDSTIRDSSSTAGACPGGGLIGGGGLTNAGGATATVQNATFAGNSTTNNGGGVENGGTIDLYNVTVAGNTADSRGDGLASPGTAQLHNTILADNAGEDCSGTISSGGYNLIEDAPGGICTVGGNATGNVIGQDPRLASGDGTDTRPLLPGSPAIDAGNPAAPGGGGGVCAGKDQRGVTRPQDGDSNGSRRCDIGAYEVAEPRPVLTVGVEGKGSGRVHGPDIDCGTDCTETYDLNEAVSLTANPAPDSTFGGWSGACSGPKTTCTVTMDGNKTVTATFTRKGGPDPVLTVSRRGNGTVTGPGINCGTDCDEPYVQGTSVSLTATTEPGFKFKKWTGACSGKRPTCTLIMDEDKSATALFKRKKRRQRSAPGGLPAEHAVELALPGSAWAIRQ